MGIKITIPNTSSDTLTFGSANTTTAAQIAGIDSGSSNGQLALYTTASGTSTERVRVDASGNVGIGTSSPGSKLQVSGIVSAIGSGTSIFATGEVGTYTLTGVTSPNYGIAYGTLTGRLNPALTVSGYDAIAFGTSQAERMRIDSSGNLLVGTTSGSAKLSVSQSGNNYALEVGKGNSSVATVNIYSGYTASGTATAIRFEDHNSVQRGSITVTTSATAYNTSSDYRLKENIQPMQGALAKVAALKPVTYTWKSTGETDEGFIAHELQEVCPSAVTGEKDAVDAEGNPQYQGIDTSFLVATLTAAIQEQQAIITSLTDRITALEAK